jgi:DNA polymerase III subunit delta'
MALKDIFCQDKAISALVQGFTGDRMAHSFIFAGAEGIGKFKTAYEWGKLLLCKNPVTKNHLTDSCDACESCRLLDAGSHPDFHHIYKELRKFTEEGKDKPPPVEMPIDVIREFLIEKVSIRPTLSRHKVFVVSEGEKLNKESQNALLKVLEEPPAYCTIILLCTRPENLLPTTRSRCQTIRFGPIAEEKIIERLQQDGLDKKRSQYFARLAAGSLGKACNWAQLERNNANLCETANLLVGRLANCQYADSLVLADQFLKAGKETGEIWTKLEPAAGKSDLVRRAHKTFITIIVSVLHDCLTLKVSPGRPITNSGQKEQIQKFADRFTTDQLCRKITVACQVTEQIDANINEKLIFHPLLLKIVSSDTIMHSQSELLNA